MDYLIFCAEFIKNLTQGIHPRGSYEDEYGNLIGTNDSLDDRQKAEVLSYTSRRNP